MQFVVERLAIDPQQPGRLGFVAAGRRQRPPDPLFLSRRIAQSDRRRNSLRQFGGQLGRSDVLARRQQNRPGHGVLQLPQISGPVAGHEQFFSLRIETHHVFVELAVGLIQKKVGIEHNILPALREIGHMEHEFVDAVVEVGTKRSAR